MELTVFSTLNRQLTCVWAFIGFGLGCAAIRAQEQSLVLDDAKFEQLHDELKPDESKLWRTIPWRISVLDAQAAASQEGKPIFIWAMDGHPLGCT